MGFLTVDGKAMPQSKAILRYVGRLAQWDGKPLYPEDPLAAFWADEIMDTLEDMAAPLMKTMGIKDQAEKEAARAALFADDGAMTPWLQKIDKRLEGWEPNVNIGSIQIFCSMNTFRNPSWID